MGNVFIKKGKKVNNREGELEMKAMVMNEFGNPDVFVKQEVDEPDLQPGYVKIRVMASCVNPIDTKIRSGLVLAATPDFPAVLHGDAAGTIVEVSSDVTDFKVGEDVFALGGGVRGHCGALAEYMVIDERLLAKKPDKISMSQAAALPVVSLTAWEALVNRGKVKKGDRVLIHGGTGGVGHVAVQLAKYLGAHVTATVSNDEKSAIASKLGADETINYTKENVEEYVRRLTDGRGFDLILDTVGKENLDRSFRAAAPKGVIISTNTRSTHDLSPLHAKGLTLHVVFLLMPLLSESGREEMGDTLVKIANLMQTGTLQVLMHDKSYGFTQVSEAHALLEKGEHIGKISLYNDL